MHSIVYWEKVGEWNKQKILLCVLVLFARFARVWWEGIK